ncbi:MAG TPA: hypothetical protein VGF71_16405 [Caulobacteraceae bacterium]
MAGPRDKPGGDGPDYMHVEVQAEGKGDAWAPVSSESFARR